MKERNQFKFKSRSSESVNNSQDEKAKAQLGFAQNDENLFKEESSVATHFFKKP